ncbi:hypothetical protein TNCT_580171 [Trichonephila clavata]|uniref:Uncharacterized protein n=1 Tax=Trichonephila clavata TaxID=2740835 RepID=A0A8X6JBM2_TRICU|nr:hypothetical protein TNCT_580171 [Trichonephila clavata]
MVSSITKVHRCYSMLESYLKSQQRLLLYSYHGILFYVPRVLRYAGKLDSLGYREESCYWPGDTVLVFPALQFCQRARVRLKIICPGLSPLRIRAWISGAAAAGAFSIKLEVAFSSPLSSAGCACSETFVNARNIRSRYLLLCEHSVIPARLLLCLSWEAAKGSGIGPRKLGIQRFNGTYGTQEWAAQEACPWDFRWR